MPPPDWAKIGAPCKHIGKNQPNIHGLHRLTIEAIGDSMARCRAQGWAVSWEFAWEVLAQRATLDDVWDYSPADDPLFHLDAAHQKHQPPAAAYQPREGEIALQHPRPVAWADHRQVPKDWQAEVIWLVGHDSQGRAILWAPPEKVCRVRFALITEALDDDPPIPLEAAA